MPTRSKFTAENRAKILQALKVGASRNMAAAIAGVDEAQIRRWIAKGKESEEGTSYREFYEACQEAEAHPGLRALGIIYKELPDNPALAWKYVERKVQGYEPPIPQFAQPQSGPVLIQLAFGNGQPTGTVIDVEQESTRSERALPDPGTTDRGKAS